MVNIHSAIAPPETFSISKHKAIPSPLPDAEERLEVLRSQIADDLEVLSHPARLWSYTRQPDLLEVAIVGGGHTGKSVAFGLRRYGITNVEIFDRRSSGKEGPWRNYARNHTLRTPKSVTGGLDWGIPNLNFSRWCIARYGKDYWQTVIYIPRLLWAEYLDWYATVLALPMQNDADVQTIDWNAEEQCFYLQTTRATYKARFVILATGMESAGGKIIPEIIAEELPSHCYVHTMDEIDLSNLLGKRVIVIGGGASAFDTANAALAAGADSVDLAIRRSTLPNVNRLRWSEWNGFHRHYIDLDDAMKWYYSIEELRAGQLPPAHTYYEAISNPRFTLYSQAPIEKLSYQNGEIVGTYGGQEMRHDFLICGTGFRMSSVQDQPELSAIAAKILRWRDVYQPEPDQQNQELSNYPYLGKSLEFLPRKAEHEYVRRIYYLASGAAWMSGFRGNLSGLQFAAPRVCYDIGRQLFLEHQTEIRHDFDSYNVLEY
jgi:FAD-dependent urate hydroxylase